MLFIYISDIPGEKKGKLFRKIKSGMSDKQVVNILGQPDAIDSSSHVTRTYEYSSGILGKSTEPMVIFDSTGTVIRAVYGD